MVNFGVEQRVAKRRIQSGTRKLHVLEAFNPDALMVPERLGMHSFDGRLPALRDAHSPAVTTEYSRIADLRRVSTNRRRVPRVPNRLRRERSLPDVAIDTNNTAEWISASEMHAASRSRGSTASYPSLVAIRPRPALVSSYLGMWLPVLVAAIIFVTVVDAQLQLLRDMFVYPPSGLLALPVDGQLEPLLMDQAVPGYNQGSGLTDAGSNVAVSEAQAVAPPADLSKFESLKLKSYTVRPGDSISTIAKKFGVNEGTIISFNDVSDVRRIQVGAVFQVPDKDGLRYTVRRGNSLSFISQKFNVPINSILDANNLKSSVLRVGQDLFIPGAKMNSFQLGLIMGNAFQWPVRGAVMTSPFGFRPDPFTGVRDFHNGIDLALYFGAPIHSAGNGVVRDVGYNSIFGNYVIISHPNNFQTLYGHMSKQLVHVGEQVAVGQTIGLMGSTGYSTGTHLHFTIYHNYQPVNPLLYLPK